MLDLFGEGGLHWSWWAWRSGYDACPRSSAIYCGPLPSNGSYTRFETAVARLARWLGPPRAARVEAVGMVVAGTVAAAAAAAAAASTVVEAASAAGVAVEETTSLRHL